MHGVQSACGAAIFPTVGAGREHDPAEAAGVGDPLAGMLCARVELDRPDDFCFFFFFNRDR